MTVALPTIAVFGASGLIGEAVAAGLMRQGFPVVPVARRFTRAQQARFGVRAVESPIVSLATTGLAELLERHDIDVIVNCVGVLQDSGRGRADEVHQGFIARLLDALATSSRPGLLIQISVPGREEDDQTAFSRSKRAAERLIMAGAVPFVILRPGFVVAPAAYGGSALIRALAALPLDLPDREAHRPFAATSVADITRTVAFVARTWRDGRRDWSARFDVMEREPGTVGDVVSAFRWRFGGPAPIARLPGWLMALGARAGDLAARLGWMPPIRSTALMEMRRGVEGDPVPWIAETGIEPVPLATMVQELPGSVQERWFARLYLLKAVVFASLALFWIVSGLIPLAFAFHAATGILTAHGVPMPAAEVLTVITSLADIAIGCAIAFRRTCRFGLLAGMALSVAYMAAAAVIAPELWLDPVGALVKTGPAVALMLAALAVLDDR
jgi:nucleoside-diphosphate-sugar epimerase